MKGDLRGVIYPGVDVVQQPAGSRDCEWKTNLDPVHFRRRVWPHTCPMVPYKKNTYFPQWLNNYTTKLLNIFQETPSEMLPFWTCHSDLWPYRLAQVPCASVVSKRCIVLRVFVDLRPPSSHYSFLVTVICWWLAEECLSESVCPSPCLCWTMDKTGRNNTTWIGVPWYAAGVRGQVGIRKSPIL